MIKIEFCRKLIEFDVGSPAQEKLHEPISVCIVVSSVYSKIDKNKSDKEGLILVRRWNIKDRGMPLTR